MKFNLIKQHNLMVCGVVCVQMILNYYDSSLPLNKLRKMTGTDRQGASAYGIVKGLEELNFESFGIEGNNSIWHDSELTLPAIAHIINEEQELHYVVVYEVSGYTLKIADPAKGKYEKSIPEFADRWTRILLLAKPTDNYRPIQEEEYTHLRLSKILNLNKKLVIKVLLTSFLSVQQVSSVLIIYNILLIQ